MNADLPRDLGEQPIGALMSKHALTAHDLVTAGTEQLTHKMVTKAVKGRRLSVHVRQKILRALNKAAGQSYVLTDLFIY